MTDDQPSLEIRFFPVTDPRLTYPLDITKNKTQFLDYNFDKRDPEDPNHKMRCTVTVKLDVADWCHQQLGYVPRQHILTDQYRRLEGHHLLFLDDRDAMLFRIRYGHLF